MDNSHNLSGAFTRDFILKNVYQVDVGAAHPQTTSGLTNAAAAATAAADTFDYLKEGDSLDLDSFDDLAGLGQHDDEELLRLYQAVGGNVTHGGVSMTLSSDLGGHNVSGSSYGELVSLPAAAATATGSVIVRNSLSSLYQHMKVENEVKIKNELEKEERPLYDTTAMINEKIKLDANNKTSQSNQSKGTVSAHNNNNNNGRPGKRQRNTKSRARPKSPTLVVKLKRTRRLKANDRERNRMHMLNTALERLRQVLPMVDENSKMTKIETLRFAHDYIYKLSETLKTIDGGSLSGASTPSVEVSAFSDHQAAHYYNSKGEEEEDTSSSNEEYSTLLLDHHRQDHPSQSMSFAYP